MQIKAVGEIAPEFELQTDAGETLRLADYRGKTVVLFFYPRADTKGCTTEACGFRDDYSGFQDVDAVILGISPDSVKDQAKFTTKHAFPFPLLADEDHAIAEAYGVWGLKKFMGREYMGVHRTTFIIDPEGKIAKVFERVKPAGHSQEVLAALSAG
jgi:peroxiredoxin Q/BCP